MKNKMQTTDAPASVTNWNLYPSAPSARWKSAISASLRFLRQLKEGEQLYASILPGNCAWMPAAKARASSRSGVEVSHQMRSAYGAYARPRAMASSTPQRTPKKPSGVRSPVRKGRSRASTSDVTRRAECASVRPMMTVGTPATSAARRAATRLRTAAAAGMSTLPPRWPHFFSDESWSSKWTAAAPASMSAPASSYALSGPPKPASASATIGRK